MAKVKKNKDYLLVLIFMSTLLIFIGTSLILKNEKENYKKISKTENIQIKNLTN